MRNFKIIVSTILFVLGIGNSIANARPPSAWTDEDPPHFVRSINSWDLGGLWRAERTPVDYAHHHAQRAIEGLNMDPAVRNNQEIREQFRRAVYYANQADILPHLRQHNINIEGLEALREAFEEDLSCWPRFIFKWVRSVGVVGILGLTYSKAPYIIAAFNCVTQEGVKACIDKGLKTLG